MTRLLVTGATGYIGSAVVRQALAADYQVYALTRSEHAAATLTSMPGPTWPNRFFVHAGSSAGLDHSPSPLTMADVILF